MKEERIKQLVDDKQLRAKNIDLPKSRSLLESAEQLSEAAKKIPLSEQMATIIFETIYTALRQIGDSQWSNLGYEPRTHEASLEILKEDNPIQFQHLDRFRIIRNDANYRGYKIRLEETQAILSFWDSYGKPLLKKIKEKIEVTL